MLPNCRQIFKTADPVKNFFRRMMLQRKEHDGRNKEMILVNREDFNVMKQLLADVERYADYLTSSNNLSKEEFETQKKN